MDQSGVQNVIFIASSNARTLIRIHLIVERNIDLSSSWFSTILLIRLSLDKGGGGEEIEQNISNVRDGEEEERQPDQVTFPPPCLLSPLPIVRAITRWTCTKNLSRLIHVVRLLCVFGRCLSSLVTGLVPFFTTSSPKISKDQNNNSTTATALLLPLATVHLLPIKSWCSPFLSHHSFFTSWIKNNNKNVYHSRWRGEEISTRSQCLPSFIRSIQRQQSLINHDQIIILQANGQLSFQSRSPFDNGWTADWGDGGHWGGILLLCRYLFFLVVVHHARHEHGWPVSILRRVCSMNDSSITVWCYVILSQTSVFVLLATSLEGVKNRMYLRALN